MKKIKLFIIATFVLSVSSCKKDEDVKQIEKTSKKSCLSIDNFEESLFRNKFNRNCIMTFSKKADKKNEIILMQGSGVQHMIGRSLFILKIDGTFQMFDSNDEKNIGRINKDMVMIKITNKDYEIEIITHLQQNIQGSNLNKYYGTIKVRRKKDKCHNSINYVGEMTC